MHTKNGGRWRLQCAGAPRSRVGFCCAQAWILVACAQLLDIPDDLRLAEPAVASELGVTSASDPGALADTDATGAEATNESVAPAPSSHDPANASPDAGDRNSDMATGSPDDAPDIDAGSGIPAALADAASTTAPAVPLCRSGDSTGPNGNCYAVIAALLPWPDARNRCRSRGTGWDLAAIHDAETNRFLAGVVSGEAWIGGSDEQQEGLWRWVRDGVEFWSGSETGGPIAGAFNNWNSDEPNGEGGSNCVRMVPRTTRWADLECDELRLGLCEGPAL